MKLSEVIPEVIRLADVIRAYWETELPKRHVDYPIVKPEEDSGPPPHEEGQLRKLLMDLPTDMIYNLITIMYIGRDGLSRGDLDQYLKEMKQDFPKPEFAVTQMMAKAPLADYLIDGLAELRKARIDVDNLIRKPATPRK